jgi:hypothetical protein
MSNVELFEATIGSIYITPLLSICDKKGDIHQWQGWLNSVFWNVNWQ